MRVAAIQHDIVWEDRAATCARLEPRLAAAAADGAGLVVLAEMFAVGFSLRTDVTAEPTDGPTATWMSEQAARHGVWIAGSVPEVREGAERPSNVLVLAGPGGERHRYAKRHPFSYAREPERFDAGDDLVTVEVDGLRLSLAVCYDLRFADQFWAQGPTTDCFIVPANWPTSRMPHWRALLVARAIENQCYVVGVNRVGEAGDGTPHAGGSCIVDPLGELVADALPMGEAEVSLLADVDAERVAEVRARFPFLADRR